MTETFGEEQSLDNHDVDQIIADAYGESESSEPRQETAAPQEQQPPSAKEYEFTARGQAIKIREDDPRFQQWLSQGYDYSTNINQFKSQREQFEKQQQELEQKYSPYKEIDEFAQKNPEWWSHVDQSYKQQLSNPQGQQTPEIPDHLKSYLEPILNDYGMVKDFVQQYQTEQIQKQQAQEDQRLESDIKSIQEKYKDLDFSTKDESGMSLEQKVLDHAVKNGFPNFRAAFYDFYHDNLEQLAEARGKEAYAKEMQKRNKMGLLDENSTPIRDSNSSFSSQGRIPKSWNDASLSGENILKEFNFG